MMTIDWLSSIRQYKNVLRLGLPICNIISRITEVVLLGEYFFNSVPFYDMNSLIQLPLSVVMQSAVLNSFNGEELLGEDGLFGEVFFGLNAS